MTPVQPANLVILAIGIVVGQSAAAEFITGNEHGRSLRKKKNHGKGFDTPGVQFFDPAISSFTLDPTVPADIMIIAIPILLAIAQIIFPVIADPIIKGETAVAGNKVDTVKRAPVLVWGQVLKNQFLCIM